MTEITKEGLLKQIDDWAETMIRKELPPEPLAMKQMLGVLNKKQIPYAIVYLTGKDESRVVNFVSSMGQSSQTMEFLKKVLDNNTVYPPDEVE